MRPRNLLILAIVVAALAAFIWFLERDLPSTEERRERAKLALGIDEDEITALVLEPADGESVRLERVPPPADGGEEEGPFALAQERWVLRHPFDGPADADAASSLASSLATLEKERTLEEFDPEALGLEPPRARVTVVTEKGERVFRVGSEIPASSNMILQREGAAEALVVSDFVYEQLVRPAGEWRSRDLFPGSREAVRRVTLERGGESLRLARRDEGFWLETPLEDRADEDAVSDLLAALVALEVDEFVDDPADPETLGLAAPAAVVEVAHGDAGETFRLELGGPVAEESERTGEGPDEPGPRYARVDGQVVVVPGDLDEALARSVAEWQSKGWSIFESWEVERATLRDAEGELALDREAGEWRRSGEPVPYGPVSDLLYALDSAMAERLVPAADLELSEPELEIVLEGDGRSESLRLYPATADGAPAAAEGRAWVALLSAGTVDDLRLKLSEVRAAEPETADELPTETPG
ncbi:MAG: DUF4340 domain-containing protein [Thermoanaerobaculia bacterium]|nr:DUF4340 domain-containing protein [Thermoanaerobaculia bacterium]